VAGVSQTVEAVSPDDLNDKQERKKYFAAAMALSSWALRSVSGRYIAFIE
jgi:hypothetical protein